MSRKNGYPMRMSQIQTEWLEPSAAGLSPTNNKQRIPTAENLFMVSSPHLQFPIEEQIFLLSFQLKLQKVDVVGWEAQCHPDAGSVKGHASRAAASAEVPQSFPITDTELQ